MHEQPDRILLSVKEASAWLGIPVFTLYNWALAGKIPCYKIEKRVLFGKDDLKKWLADHRRNAAG